jgi:putative transposase
MKLIVNLKLKTLESQHNALLATLKEANKACDWISETAFQNKTYKQFDLHKLCYYSVKESFNLSAQMIIRAIAKVVDSYKIQTKKQTVFKPLGSIAYDDRIISFKANNQVSLWTVEGRLTIPFVCGEHQQKLLQFRKGEVDLIYRKGNFYLNAVCDVPEESPLIPDDIIELVRQTIDAENAELSLPIAPTLTKQKIESLWNA